MAEAAEATGAANSAEDQTMAEKCEHLMNVVVESRKQFGKMCMDYEKKAADMEIKLLNLKRENIANAKIKPRTPLPSLDVEEMKKELDDFAEEILARRAKFDNLKKKKQEAHRIMNQIKQDDKHDKLNKPLTAKELLERAKAKQPEEESESE